MARRAFEATGIAVAATLGCAPPGPQGDIATFGSGTASVGTTLSVGSETTGSGSSESGESGSDDAGSSETTAPATTTPAESTSSDGGDESSSTGAPMPVDCVGLDEATCGVTMGCAWPVNANPFGGMMGPGPCGWDPLACPTYDETACMGSLACTWSMAQDGESCTAVACEVLDQPTCPKIAGCAWVMGDGAGFCYRFA